MLTKKECDQRQFLALGYKEVHILAAVDKQAAQDFLNRLIELSPSKGLASGKGKPAQIKSMIMDAIKNEIAATQGPAR